MPRIPRGGRALEQSNLTGEALVAAHKNAIRKLRILSIAFPIVFISLILTFLAGFVGQIRNVDRAGVGAGLSHRVNSLMPDLNQSMGEIADSVQPAMTKAIQAESLALAPEIQKRLQADGDRTIDAARHDLERTAGKSMQFGADAQRALLIKQFPNLANSPEAQDKVLAAA